MSGEQHVPTSDAMEPRVPLTEYSARVSVPMVPFGPAGVTEQAATADYFDSAARNIAGGYAVGGYNVTSTVVALLHRTADALRAPQVRALPDRYDVYTAMRIALEEAGAPDAEEIASKAGVALHVKPMALPDRETIARAIHDASRNYLGMDWEELRPRVQQDYLEQAEAVLALFGQEGQR